MIGKGKDNNYVMLHSDGAHLVHAPLHFGQPLRLFLLLLVTSCCCLVASPSITGSIVVPVMATHSSAIDSTLWSKTVGSGNGATDYYVKVVSDGNSTIAIGLTDGTVVAPPLGAQDCFIHKMSYTGETEWIIQVGTDAEDQCWGVAVDNNHNVVVAGQTKGSFNGFTNPDSSTWDIFALKYDASGSLLHHYQLPLAAHQYVHDIDIDSTGNVFIVGHTTASLPGKSNPDGSTDSIVLKLSPTLSLLGSYQSQLSGADTGRTIVVDANDDIIIAGNCEFAMPGNDYVASNDFFVMKIASSTLTRVWVQQKGTASSDTVAGNSKSIGIDAAGNIYLAITTGGAFASYTNPNPGTDDIVLVKLNSNGGVLFFYQVGTSAGDSAAGMVVSPNGIVTIVGQTSGSWPPFTLSGSGDAIIVRVDGSSNAAAVPISTFQVVLPEYNDARGVSLDWFGNPIVVMYNHNDGTAMKLGSYAWETGSYGACGTTCLASRRVECVGSDHIVVPDSKCTELQPVSTIPCSGGMCETAAIFISPKTPSSAGVTVGGLLRMQWSSKSGTVTRVVPCTNHPDGAEVFRSCAGPYEGNTMYHIEILARWNVGNVTVAAAPELQTRFKKYDAAGCSGSSSEPYDSEFSSVPTAGMFISVGNESLFFKVME
jgi:hypothetical protein